MIINSGLKSKENLQESYLADSLMLLSRESKEKVNGTFVLYKKIDVASVLKNRANHQFLVQFITGSHKGEIYELRYNKSSRDDGSIFKYFINQQKLLANSSNLPAELQASIQCVNNNKIILTKDLITYVKLVNTKALDDILLSNTQIQPE